MRNTSRIEQMSTHHVHEKTPATFQCRSCTATSDGQPDGAATELNNSATLWPDDKSAVRALLNWTNLVTLGKDIVLRLKNIWDS